MRGKSDRQQRMQEKQSRLEARQCQCGRWFSTVNGRRVTCYRCEEDGRAPGMAGAKAG
jgi:hypothetical protein